MIALQVTGRAFLVACALLATVAGAAAETGKQVARDSAAIQSCIRSAKGNPRTAERCIETVAGPCLKQPSAQSTAGMVECAAREAAVWDDILNETFRRLRDKLDEEQKGKLRDMQRAWIESRDRTCGFYDVFHEGGSIARPMAALCNNRETARRALFLLTFLNDAEGR